MARVRDLRVGSLFSGIGGYDLGLERAGGFRTAWFCEQDQWCHRVLAQHWPGVPCYPDITELRAADVAPVDVLCGGFPCQDVSNAGKRAGIEGERSGLWSEYARLVGELRPRYVLVENVAPLRRRGLDRVVGDLAALGYDAEWDCIRASDFGAAHRRDRLWLVAYPQRELVRIEPRRLSGPHRAGPALTCVDGEARSVADPEGLRPELRAASGAGPSRPSGEGDPRRVFGARRPTSGSAWPPEPDVGRVADGVPARVDRLRGLGNALVPPIAEWIGARILEWEAANAV